MELKWQSIGVGFAMGLLAGFTLFYQSSHTVYTTNVVPHTGGGGAGGGGVGGVARNVNGSQALNGVFGNGANAALLEAALRSRAGGGKTGVDEGEGGGPGPGNYSTISIAEYVNNNDDGAYTHSTTTTTVTTTVKTHIIKGNKVKIGLVEEVREGKEAEEETRKEERTAAPVAPHSDTGGKTTTTTTRTLPLSSVCGNKAPKSHLPQISEYVGLCQEKGDANAVTDRSKIRILDLHKVPFADCEGDVIYGTGYYLHFWLATVIQSGAKRCTGGDQYEIRIESETSKLHARIEDLNNGLYHASVLVQESGEYTISAILPFEHGGGISFHNDETACRSRLAQPIAGFPFVASLDATEFALLPSPLTPRRCTPDLLRQSPYWEGRWQLLPKNAAGERRCVQPYCVGDNTLIGKTGWVYAPSNCQFRFITRPEMYTCVRDKWFMWWGDSNHQDSSRNLFRSYFDQAIRGGEVREGDQTADVPGGGKFRLTWNYNGHTETLGDDMGLITYDSPQYQARIGGYFGATSKPDAVLLNTGMHDGAAFRTQDLYLGNLDRAFKWWQSLRAGPAANIPFIWRHTITPAYPAGCKKANPISQNWMNAVTIQKLYTEGDAGKKPYYLIDGYDLTFPFHWDLQLNGVQISDGGHYGRERFPTDIDSMLIHIIFNQFCALIGRPIPE